MRNKKTKLLIHYTLSFDTTSNCQILAEPFRSLNAEWYVYEIEYLIQPNIVGMSLMRSHKSAVSITWLSRVLYLSRWAWRTVIKFDPSLDFGDPREIVLCTGDIWLKVPCDSSLVAVFAVSWVATSPSSSPSSSDNPLSSKRLFYHKKSLKNNCTFSADFAFISC